MASKSTGNTEKASVSDYIKQQPAARRKVLNALRKLILETAPGAEEKISYGMPAYHMNGPLVYFSDWKSHLGFYPTPSGIARFSAELSGYVCSKGAIQFPHDAPLPEALIQNIIRFRVEENQLKKAGTKKKAC